MNIESLLNWGSPQETTTRFGAKILRLANPSAAFWGLWKSQKADLQSAGVSVRKGRDGWEVCWWQNPDGSASTLTPTPAAAVPPSARQFADTEPTDDSAPAFTWSPEQEAIFEQFRLGPASGNVVVKARAGTGKTTTIKQAFTYAPEDRILYAVFNKKNQREAQAKISDSRVEIRTLHALGFSFIKDVWANATPDDEVEFDRLLSVAGALPSDVSAICLKLVAFAKNLCLGMPTLADLLEIIEERALMLEEETEEEATTWPAKRIAEIALGVLKASMTADPAGRISFNDMVWLPVACNWVRPRFDLVVVDEAQDMNLVQLTMAIRACTKAGRIVIVGDDRQAIYGFRGAASDGLNFMKAQLGAIEKTLTVTRRCPKRVVEIAARVVPGFTAAECAPEGRVDNVGLGQVAVQARVGDAILSRVNAPLVPLFLELIRRGTPAKIEGRDVGKTLLRIVESIKAKTVPDFLKRLNGWRTRGIKRAMAAGKGGEAKIALIEDQFSTLVAVTDGLSSSSEIVARLRTMFKDSDTDARPTVTLSSVHKAKGLEWDRVFLLAGTFKSVTDDTEGEEANIYYVAVTRTKQHLIFAA